MQMASASVTAAGRMAPEEMVFLNEVIGRLTAYYDAKGLGDNAKRKALTTILRAVMVHLPPGAQENTEVTA